jgi:hypothetical protein
MKKLGLAALTLAGAVSLLTPSLAVAAPEEQGQGQAVVTVMPKNDKSEAPVNIQQSDLQVKVNGKESSVTQWTPARGAGSPLELVLLIDSSARTSLGTQLGEIEGFVKEMPAHTKMGIAYMENGRAVFNGPLSSDAAQVLTGLHLPAGGAGVSSSPYFCLSDLAKNWPSNDRTARREVVMVTDGVDYYNLRYDPDDPYVQAAITDSARAGLVVYSIYWQNRGRVDRSFYENNAGQNLLSEVTQATGGNSYWEGIGNPVSFDPYFKDLRARFANQYRLGFQTGLKGKPELLPLKLRAGGPEAKIYYPQQVFVAPASANPGE